ncbi:hypothetical protein ACVWWG_005972 [Bradyrhizobium sp. LB7.2]
MAIAEQHTSSEAVQTSSDKSWHGIVLQTLKRNEISLIPYVPDRVLTPLIKNLHADPFFTTLLPPRVRRKPSASFRAHGWADGGLRC